MTARLGITNRRAIYDVLPVDPPGLTRDEILALMPERNIAYMTFLVTMSNLMAIHGAISDGRRVRRYRRGSVVPPSLPAYTNPPWAPELVAELRRLWVVEPVMSASQIGAILGKSREAVTSKAHSMGLVRRASPILPPVERPERYGWGGEALPAGHPLSWRALLAHTPSIADMPGPWT